MRLRRLSKACHREHFGSAFFGAIRIAFQLIPVCAYAQIVIADSFQWTPC